MRKSSTHLSRQGLRPLWTSFFRSELEDWADQSTIWDLVRMWNLTQIGQVSSDSVFTRTLGQVGKGEAASGKAVSAHISETTIQDLRKTGSVMEWY
jgi:hypothetical protein